jgi:hypothetical protein
LRQGVKYKVVAVFEANSPLIRHLVGKKLPLAGARKTMKAYGGLLMVQTSSAGIYCSVCK